MPMAIQKRRGSARRGASRARGLAPARPRAPRARRRRQDGHRQRRRERGEEKHRALVVEDELQEQAPRAAARRRAPALSIARCRPKARPRCSGGTMSAIRASRGEVRMPLPTRSAKRIASTWRPARREADERPDDGGDRVAGRRRAACGGGAGPTTSPETIFMSDAVASATPSMIPRAAGPAWRVRVRKSGKEGIDHVGGDVGQKRDPAEQRGRPRSDRALRVASHIILGIFSFILILLGIRLPAASDHNRSVRLQSSDVASSSAPTRCARRTASSPS